MGGGGGGGEGKLCEAWLDNLKLLCLSFLGIVARTVATQVEHCSPCCGVSVM